jgi:hypothetical protein
MSMTCVFLMWAVSLGIVLHNPVVPIFYGITLIIAGFLCVFWDIKSLYADGY